MLCFFNHQQLYANMLTFHIETLWVYKLTDSWGCKKMLQLLFYYMGEFVKMELFYSLMLPTMPQETLPGPHITQRASSCWKQEWNNSHICNLNLLIFSHPQLFRWSAHLLSWAIARRRRLKINTLHSVISWSDIILSLLSIMVRP